ncbi:MAG: hypothetical protein H6648_07100 [Caldilineae bacterium]|nr:hypothetical protein [Caldilineae bacterium]
MNRRTRALCLAALLATSILSILAGLAEPQPPGRAQAPGTADLVVDFGDGRVRVDRVAVVSGSTGLELLQRSDLELALSNGAVCGIDGVGCPASDCFCACRDLANCRFWGYHDGLEDGAWQAYEIGAGESRIGPGAVEGWVWGRPEPVLAPRSMRAALLAADWLAGFQTASGGLADHPGFTVEAIAGFRGAGIPLLGPQADAGRGLADFLAAQAGVYAADGAAPAGKALAGVVAAGLDPRRLAGGDLIARVEATYSPTSRWYGASVWDQAWAIIGLRAAGRPVPPEAVAALASASAASGAWGGMPMAEAADGDSTGLVLQALAAAGARAEQPEVAAALSWLEGMRQADGGFAHERPEDGSNLNATALIVQGLIGLGLDPSDPRWTRVDRSPLDYLTSRQQPDGRLQFAAEPVEVSDLVASLQGLPAMAGRSMPLAGRRVAVEAARDWMREQRDVEGAFLGFNPGASIDAVLALAAAGLEPEALGAPSGGAVPGVAGYLASVAADYAGRGPSAAGKLSAGAVALGADPRDFGGVDLVARIQSSYQPISGTFGAGGTWDQAWALIGLAAAEAPIPAEAVEALRRAAAEGGGWGFEAGAAAADADSTGLALQALAAAGLDPSDSSARAGLAFLQATQLEDGGWGEASANAGSTALAIGGLVAMGQHVDGAGWMRGRPGAALRRGPIESLQALQSPGGGFPGFSGPEDPHSTYAALLGLSARALPVRPLAQAPLYLPVLTRNR